MIQWWNKKNTIDPKSLFLKLKWFFITNNIIVFYKYNLKTKPEFNQPEIWTKSHTTSPGDQKMSITSKTYANTSPIWAA